MVFVCTCAIAHVQRTTLGNVLSCQIKAGYQLWGSSFYLQSSPGAGVTGAYHYTRPSLLLRYCVAVRQQAERVRFPLYHMGFRDLTQVLRLGSQAPYLLSHLAGGFIRGQTLAISHDGLKPRNLVHSVMV